MTWRPELQGGCEQIKIAALVVPYLQGRSLDIGSGPGKLWPAMTGIDTRTDAGRPVTDLCMDGADLSLFGDKTMDAVFSSFLLSHIKNDPARVLCEWWRLLKIGGNLVLYLPHRDLIPMEEAKVIDPDYKKDFLPEEIVDIMKEVGSWTMLEDETRDDGHEYGFLQVYHRDE